MTERAQFTLLIPFLGALTALGPLSNDLYVPSLPLVATGLGAPGGSVQLTMSSLLLGFSLGCLIYGPLSDRYGRKPVLLLGLALYVLAGALSALSADLGTLVACRFLQGMGASSGMVLARAIILDRWTGEQASRALSWIMMITFLTPVIAPLIGGYVASLGYWPSVFWLQAGAGAVCLLAVAMLPGDARAGSMTVARALGAYATILKDSETLGYLACVGLTFVGVIAFVTNSAIVFTGHFGLEPYQFGFCFSFVMAGGSIGSYLNSRLVDRRGISSMIGIGTVILAAGGTAVLVTSAMDAGLMPTLLSLLLYVFGVGFVFANSVARTMSRFRENSGAASSIFGVNQFLIGSIVAAALSLVATPTPMPLASAMAFAGLGAAGVWWGWLKHASVPSA